MAYMDLLDIISNRPILGTNHVCPYCDSERVKQLNHEQTVMGGIGRDPNHHWYSCLCEECKKEFTHEIKCDNSWYTKHSRDKRDGLPCVIKGVSSCFESYEYQCLKCGGAVHRKHKDFAGNPVTTLRYDIIDGKNQPQFTVHYNCTVCGHGGIVENERVV